MLTKTPVLEAMPDKPALFPNGSPLMLMVLPVEVLRAWYLNYCHNTVLQMRWYEKKILSRDCVTARWNKLLGVLRAQKTSPGVFKVTVRRGMLFITDSPCRFVSCFSEMPVQVSMLHLLHQAQWVYREELKT